MYRERSIAVVIPVFDEAGKIERVLARMPRFVDAVYAIDDGSRDGSGERAAALGAIHLRHAMRRGVGAALRTGFRRARADGHAVVVVLAGNDKDAPEEMTRLLDPIVEDRADLVQGSRYLEPGDFGDMQVYRRLATRLHPVLFSLASGRRVTESTNGYRAMRAALLADPRLGLDAPRLDRYGLEPHLYLAAIALGYRTTEVPVSKVYPHRSRGRTKMPPIVGWWSILRPVVAAGLSRVRRRL